MKPSQVLDMHADLLVRAHSSAFLRFVRGVAAGSQKTDGSRARRGEEIANQYAANLGWSLKAAYPYHVNVDMSLMVQAIAEQLGDLDRFDVHAAPTPHGLVFFERPLPMVDSRGQVMLVHWVAWGRVATNAGPGIAMWEFNDRHIDPDTVDSSITQGLDPEERERYDRAVGRWSFIGCDAIPQDARLGPALIEPDEEKRQIIMEDGDTPVPATNPTRWLQALWLLLNQTVVEVRQEEAERPYARRARRANLPTRVTVITLRRREYHGDPVGETAVEWSHRWLVRPYLRWTACGPNHPLATEVTPGVFRARIVVAGHVKGPEDKPLMVTEKVYALHR